MEEKKELSERDKALSLLGDKELILLEEFKSSGKAGLAPSLSASFFELYLNGNDVFEIQKLNKAYDIGAIIDCKVRFSWDEKKDAYINNLHTNAMSRLMQVQMESANFLADVLSAAHKRHGIALRKYLQSGDPRDIEGFDIGNISSYSKSIEALMKITGQDQKKKVQLEGTLNSNIAVSEAMERPMTQNQAANILEILADDEDSDD